MLRRLALIAIVVMPAGVGIAAVSDSLVPIVLGPKWLAAVLLIIGGEKRLAVSRASTVVDPQNHVAVIDQVLNHSAVACSRLAARTSVNPQQRRGFLCGARLMGLVQDGWNRHAIERFVPDDF